MALSVQDMATVEFIKMGWEKISVAKKEGEIEGPLVSVIKRKGFVMEMENKILRKALDWTPYQSRYPYF